MRLLIAICVVSACAKTESVSSTGSATGSGGTADGEAAQRADSDSAGDGADRTDSDSADDGGAGVGGFGGGWSQLPPSDGGECGATRVGGITQSCCNGVLCNGECYRSRGGGSFCACWSDLTQSLQAECQQPTVCCGALTRGCYLPMACGKI